MTPDANDAADADGVPGTPPGAPGARLLALVGIMDTLRTSCPWDQEQTHASLARYLLEEAYEAVDEIETGDFAALREELGDVLLQVLFHARIASERPPDDGGFTIDDVAGTLAAKLVRRHPHVFGTVTVSSAADVNANWDEIKKAERAAKAAAAGPGGPAGPSGPGGDTAGGVQALAPSVLDGVPFGQPALSLAAQLQRRAGRAGLSVPWNGTDPASPDPAAGDAAARNAAARNAASPGAAAADGKAALTGEQVGAELMALVARAQAAGLDPEMELRAAARRFADEVRVQERQR